jgi:hypothetical protein
MEKNNVKIFYPKQEQALKAQPNNIKLRLPLSLVG